MAIREARRRRSDRLARHEIRERVEQRILSGQYHPGTRLVQHRLAAEFGVSQGVIRESLFELQKFGLVQITDRLGASVCELTGEKAIEAYEVREVHEGLAARLCCEHLSRAEINELEKLAERIDALATEGRVKELAGLDRQFHHKIVLLSRNEMLVQLADSYRVLTKAFWLDHEGRPLQLTVTHATLIKAIKENRPADAERLMREHIREGLRRIRQQVADGTFAPKWIP